MTLEGLLGLYSTEKEADNKPGTRTIRRTITNDLIGFFKADTDPRELTLDDGKKSLDHLKARELAAPTAARRARRARSIFGFAVK